MLTTLAFADALPSPEPGASSGMNLGYSGTMLWPDARRREAGEAEVAVGTGLAVVEVVEMCLRSSAGGGCGGTAFEPLAVPDVRVAWSPGADFRLETNLGYALGGTGFIGDLTAAWSTPVSSRVRLGGFLGVATTTFSDFSGFQGALGAVGFTLSAAWPKIGFDLSMPLWAVDTTGELPGLLAFAATEANLSFALGRGHALRVGFFSAGPGVGWQWSGAHWLARAEVHSLGVVSAGRVEVGARF